MSREHRGNASCSSSTSTAAVSRVSGIASTATWSRRNGAPGGEALPLPRAVVANGDFEQCRRFHVHREHRRTSATLFRGNSA
ncbi:hypothetical protein [Streptomyces sp. NBC_01483]|uniref:hypothetical protein n=1 Tax=Streptomyces sp. NBC_01483 TaxID=2903883 RepID=UPI002E370C4F|nr:hypothetical protein [Streptomyces sp. NBC_01483]